MKSNKGFTLIELLAVIVVLAIIALIATPVVLNSISTARTGANKESARAFVKAAEFYCATELLKPTPVVVPSVNFTASAVPAGISVKGTKPTAASLTLSSSCLATGTVTLGGTTYTVGTDI